MWTDWLERILRPRARDEDAIEGERDRSVAGAAHASRLDRPRADVNRSTRESVEQTTWC